MKFLKLLIFLLFSNQALAETLLLQCSNIEFKIYNFDKDRGYNAFIRYSKDGKFSKVLHFMKMDSVLQFQAREIWNPSRCDTKITSLYMINRNTGLLTKEISFIKPENGKPTQQFLNETKMKFKGLDDKSINQYIEAFCKPKKGPASVRNYQSLGYSKTQIENIIQTDKNKWNEIVNELRKTDCKKVTKKF